MTSKASAFVAKTTFSWLVSCGVIAAASDGLAATVNYTLENVVLEDNTHITGVFSWTFTDDFNSGTGQWISLEIPWTTHDQDDVDTTFELDTSIEITLAGGSVHDDGIDITLFLIQPLTPNTSSSIDLVRSKYEIGGNGFHDGLFLSGSISAALSGDFNGNGMVAAADYTLWRDNESAQTGYDTWKANFGATSGSGSLSNATVPEPATLGLLGLPIAIIAAIVCHSSLTASQTSANSDPQTA